MSDVVNSNAQTPEVPTPATPAGPSLEEIQAKVTELEKAREGLIRDVQQERAKRQELEARLSQPPASSPAQPDVNQDELAKVLNPYLAPVVKQVEAANKELETLRLEKAQSYLSTKMGKTWDQIETDTAFQDKLLSVVRKYGVSGNIYDRTVRAYELLQLEDLKAKEADRIRAAQAASVQSLPSGAPPASSSAAREYSAEEFNRMGANDFDLLSSKGSFRKDASGKFVYTPNA